MLEPPLEVEVARVVRIGERVAHDHELLRGAVERIARGVGAAMLHGLEHPRHVVPNRVGSPVVAIDDSCDPAHQGRTSMYFSRSQYVTAARNCSHSSRL